MSERIKVVQLITTMADGGAETLVKDYTLLCNRNLIDMRIIVWSEPLGTANERILREAGIDVIYLGAEKLKNPTRNPLKKIKRKIDKYLYFRNYIIKEKIDTIHIHLKFGNYFKLLPTKVLKRTNLIYTLHNEPEKYFDINGTKQQKSEYYEAKRLIDKYDLCVVVLHEEMNEKVRKLFSTDRVYTINNGVNFERFNSDLYSREEIRNSLGLTPNIKLIGHVGSFTYQKNHEMLLRIYKEYKKQNANSHLLLVGRGVLKEQTLRRISEMELEDSVTVLENRSDIPELMSAMDVFLLPSRWEGFPVVMLEAQRMGKRCVISNRINKEVVLSNQVYMNDIDGDISNWIRSIDGDSIEEPIQGKFENYDIRTSILKLQELYATGKCNTDK